ncbi:MAG: transketolase family protein, partial [Acetobacteraceae bacterium]|nr:transketolase family protein [Acetobacteraceae bacterium]
LPEGAFDTLRALATTAAETGPVNATRVHSGAALEQLVAAVPAMVGGSADLTGSNNTKTKGMTALDAPDYAGRYVNWGIREHGMAAAMNGMALHGGVIPYAGTFLTFSDYMRPSIRLAALMGIRVVHVMTHDSIGLGEDGPTHQPVEHLAALRAIPNLHVFRPADAVETAECWELALQARTRPSILSLSRQKTKAARTEKSDLNLSARGAYVLRAASAEPKAAIFATGTEVEVALAAREILEGEGVPTRVISVPSWDLFEAQEVDYRNELLGWTGEVKVAVEAGIAMGWERFIGRDGAFIGMTGFGASAPAEQLYMHFGITDEAVVAAVRARLPDATAL